MVVSFENQLTESESEFTSTSTEVSGYYFKDTFTDPKSYVTFDHYYSDWGQGYSFAGFTYTNKTSHFQNCQPNCGNIKTGEVYLGVYSDENTTASMTIIDSQYSIKGLWITTSKNAYIGMTEGDSYARPFKKEIGMRLLRQDTTIKGKKLLKQKLNLPITKLILINQ